MMWNPYRRIRVLEAMLEQANYIIDNRAQALWEAQGQADIAARERDDARTNLARMTESYGQERRDRLLAEAERDELRAEMERRTAGLRAYNARRKRAGEGA